MIEAEWERCCAGMKRLKVDGGYLYNYLEQMMCFVPDIDLNRYQSHLRDAYNKGYEDGKEDAKMSLVIKKQD